MRFYKYLPITFLILLAVTLIPNAKGDVRLTFPTNSKLCFQNDVENYLTIEVVEGTLNLTDFNFHLDSGGGYFKFATPTPVSIKIVCSNLTVKVSGDQGNELRSIDSGSIITTNAGDRILIIWDRQIEPLLPMMFIFGIVGLGAMIGGPLYAINKIKKREYLEALRTGTIVTVIGISLFIAWLW